MLIIILYGVYSKKILKKLLEICLTCGNTKIHTIAEWLGIDSHVPSNMMLPVSATKEDIKQMMQPYLGLKPSHTDLSVLDVQFFGVEIITGVMSLLFGLIILIFKCLLKGNVGNSTIPEENNNSTLRAEWSSEET